MQTRLQSWIEAWANIFVGYTVNIMANFTIFPWFGLHISLSDNLLMGVIYTGISLVRSYCLRRYFNHKHSGKAVQ